MKRLFLKLAIVVLFAVVASCKKNDKGPDPDNPSGPSAKEVKATVVAALASKDSLSTYASLFGNVELNNTDVTEGVTIFAPVNKAFTALSLSSTKGILSMASTKSVSVANTILPDSSDAKDYIVKGKLLASALTNGAVFTSLSGKQLTISISNGNVYVNGVLMTGVNISTGNNYVVFSIAAFINDTKLLKITNLSDNMALPGWLLTINGQYFSHIPTENIVKINGTQATVHTANAHQLVVTVPQGATSGNVTVVVNGKNALGKQRLNIMQATVSSIPQIAALNPGGVQGLAFDANDNLFFTDNYFPPNNPNTLTPFVRRFDDRGDGTGYSYRPNFPNPNQDGTTIPAFGNLGVWAVVVDKQNNVYVSSNGGKNAYPGIFKFNTSTPGIAEWWAGTATPGAGIIGEKHSVQLYIVAMKFDNAGNLIYGNNVSGDNAGLMKISTNGFASTIANAMAFRSADPTIMKPPLIYGLDIDNTGNVYLGDNANARIWMLSSTGVPKVLAGNANSIAKDGVEANAQFGAPFGLVLDKRGNIYVCDNDYAHNSFLIRMINPQGVVTTIAGKPNSGNIVNGVGTNASFSGVNAIAIDSKGVLYVGSDNGSVRKITIEVPPGQ